MTTRSRHTLCNTPPEYAVGDVVTIKKYKLLSYHPNMERFNGIKVTIRSISVIDVTDDYGFYTEFLKVHNGAKICMYDFHDNPDFTKIDINKWTWYFYDFEESYKKRKIKLYKK